MLNSTNGRTNAEIDADLAQELANVQAFRKSFDEPIPDTVQPSDYQLDQIIVEHEREMRAKVTAKMQIEKKHIVKYGIRDLFFVTEDGRIELQNTYAPLSKIHAAALTHALLHTFSEANLIGADKSAGPIMDELILLIGELEESGEKV
jgi:hypothetical protein